MQLKEGDILVSKYFWQQYHGSISIIIPDNEYTISHIYEQNYWNDETDHPWFCKLLLKSSNSMQLIQYHGNLEHFYTDKELRKKKLEVINEIR